MKRLIRATTDNVKLQVEYAPYDRYGGEQGLKKATVSGVDLLDALKKMSDHMALYVDSYTIEEEDMTAQDVINNIERNNGDGCDYIVSLTDLNTGEVLVSADWYEEEEEDWDD